MKFVRLRRASDCPNPEAATKIVEFLRGIAEFIEEPYPTEGWIGYYLELGVHQIFLEREKGARYYSVTHLDLGLCTQGSTKADCLMMMDDIVVMTLEDVIADPRDVIHTWTAEQYQADEFIARLGGFQATLDDWKRGYAEWLAQ